MRTIPAIRLSRATLSRVALAAATLILPFAATAQRREPPPSQEAAQYSFASIVRKAAPAVVNVYVETRLQAFRSPFEDEPTFRRFFNDRSGAPPERFLNALGSGVIVSPDGIIVTNTHVIKASGATEIRVALADKREFKAVVVLQDEKTDIAILKIATTNGEDFPFLSFENSDTLEVGDLVLAIGNPFGVGQTVTSGIISALARTEITQSDSQVFIQTDAAINPGNSGGALVDMEGKLVGINTAIFSRSGGSHGIGFAIPSNLVRLYVESARSGEKVERPWLGARLEPVTRELAQQLRLDRVTGAVVTRVVDLGPAAAAGLLQGDVIVRVDGVDVADPRAVFYRLTTLGVGKRATFDIIRQGRPTDVTIALVKAPEPGRDDIRNLSGPHPFDGARVANILPAIADELGVDESQGVVVVSLRGGSIGARLGFQPGDVIVRVGNANIRRIADLEAVLRTRQRIWLLAIKRAGRVMQFRVQG